MNVERNRTMGKIMAKAWSDPGFKERLRSEPAAALMELQISLPKGMEIAVLENTPRRHTWSWVRRGESNLFPTSMTSRGSGIPTGTHDCTR